MNQSISRYILGATAAAAAALVTIKQGHAVHIKPVPANHADDVFELVALAEAASTLPAGVVIVRSSSGDIIVGRESGVVQKIIGDTEGNLSDIFWFDMKECDEYWEQSRQNEYDIIDLGYQYRTPDGLLREEPPAHDWREEIKEEMFRQQRDATSHD